MLMVESVSATECSSEMILLMKNLANLSHNCCSSSTARFWAVHAECNNRFVIFHRSLQFSDDDSWERKRSFLDSLMSLLANRHAREGDLPYNLALLVYVTPSIVI